MSAAAAKLLLLVVIPPDWDADPAGVKEFRRCLVDKYGARMNLRQARVAMRSPLALYFGAWPLGTIW
ncbi:hypothetical protein [Deinococcus sp. QL22]|uniref:hypothetical protein n=1 Tax=Deinococcus sp. QL22 TaxID=2939437 RepID=UPI002016D96D|nr:hypothetical protein [Deinococcus sp. QL22]UQN08035.1 hypothetical protein M1R55_18255 [Deinococcus sp. QL22]